MILDIDRYSHVASSLQRWDARFKIVAVGIYILALSFVESLPVILIGFGFAVAFILLSRIPFHFVAKLLQWVVIFLLPFFVILPLSYAGAEYGEFLGITFAWEGVRLATLIVIKAVTIVISAFAIFGTSRFDIAMFALQRLKCPGVIVQMLLFTYRYIFVFLAEMDRMDTAMKARGFVKRPNANTIKVMGGFVGTLLIRSFERTERVFKAMLSKGYQGELHTSVEFCAGAKDFVKSALVIAASGMLLIFEFNHFFHRAVEAWY